MKAATLIGIDPGVHTGLAIWGRDEQKFVEIKTMTILEAINRVSLEVVTNETGDVEIWFEDARLRKWFGNSGREKLQGAGSVKRDCAIWEELCKSLAVSYKAIAPKNNKTKVPAVHFNKFSGWQGRTSEHARDAAMLVIGA
jgi:hypothetical protein